MNKQAISNPILIAGAIVLLVVLLVAGRFCMTAATIEVTVNDTPLTIHGAKTMQTAIRESGLPVNPGDFISLSGTILKRSEGYPFFATVNGEETSDPDYQLHDGDVITLADGKDLVEDYDSVEEAIPHGGTVYGVGAICKVEAGSDGVMEVRTGRTSGDVVRRVKQEETDATCVSYNPEVGGDKVLALTFSDGPSIDYTSRILDILRDNDARATFFCLESNIAGKTDLLKRERSEGHQVCLNTYATNLKTTKGSDEESIDAEALASNIDSGLRSITEALEGEEPSRIIRLTNSALTDDAVGSIDSKIEATVGWNVDTGDRAGANADAIYQTLLSLENGDIVLLHDDGEQLEATTEALGRALPRLKARGFSFVTIDDLMGYPAQ